MAENRESKRHHMGECRNRGDQGNAGIPMYGRHIKPKHRKRKGF